MRQPREADWSLRQRLSWKVGQARGKAGRSYSCPWWADKRVYALAFLQAVGFGPIVTTTANQKKTRQRLNSAG
jgi:hypothetical protein